jgi:hypothetical protein
LKGLSHPYRKAFCNIGDKRGKSIRLMAKKTPLPFGRGENEEYYW